MSEHCSHTDARETPAPGVHGAVRDRWLVTLTILTLVRTGEACAADAAAKSLPATPGLELRPSVSLPPSPFAGPVYPRAPRTGPLDREPLFPDPLLAAPGTDAMAQVPESDRFAGKDFRPRGRSSFDTDPRIGGPEDNLTFDKTIWQRLAEYRTRDRIRVLTLWESGAGAVSIQTNHRGDPSLQWTSRLMNRGGATHGLLDQLFPVSPFAGDGATHVTRSAASQGGKSSSILGALHFGAGSTPP